MGFSTTMTTQLKSVGDAVQIVGLIVGGSIILNVPNCTSQTLSPGLILLLANKANSASHYSHRCQYDLYHLRRLHGISAARQYLGQAGLLLVGQYPVCWVHCVFNHDLIQYGWVHPSFSGERNGLVSDAPMY